jgi:hypothetical protein
MKVADEQEIEKENGLTADYRLEAIKADDFIDWNLLCLPRELGGFSLSMNRDAALRSSTYEVAGQASAPQLVTHAHAV